MRQEKERNGYDPALPGTNVRPPLCTRFRRQL
jgi:hypothetical protein